jgi:hypothetical protein
MKRVAFALVVLAAPATHAGDGTLEVPLGKTIEVKVGYARGWFCDDPSFIKADLVTRGDVNVWVVTGAKLGATQCRVGTDPYTTVHYVFDVRVIAAKKS